MKYFTRFESCKHKNSDSRIQNKELSKHHYVTVKQDYNKESVNIEIQILSSCSNKSKETKNKGMIKGGFIELLSNTIFEVIIIYRGLQGLGNK